MIIQRLRKGHWATCSQWKRAYKVAKIDRKLGLIYFDYKGAQTRMYPMAMEFFRVYADKYNNVPLAR